MKSDQPGPNPAGDSHGKSPNPRGHLGISKAQMDQFLDVTQAFKTIRDGRLYREEFGSFDEYCRSKWGKSADEINWLIAEAEVELQVRKGNPGRQ